MTSDPSALKADTSTPCAADTITSGLLFLILLKMDRFNTDSESFPFFIILPDTKGAEDYLCPILAAVLLDLPDLPVAADEAS